MNKQELQQEIAKLQKQLEEKQKALDAMPDKWEPKGGRFCVDAYGEVIKFSSEDGSRLFGAEYHTREEAEKAAKAMRTHNRLLAYVAEFAPDWGPNWGDFKQMKCFIYFDNTNKEWSYAWAYSDIYACTIYMPRDIAIDLVQKLNSGEVEL